MGGFSGLAEARDAFYVKDKKWKHIYVKSYRNYILVFLGTIQIKKKSSIINRLEEKIRITSRDVD